MTSEFPIWGETLGYERGYPHSRQPPECSEEGVLIPTTEGYDYQMIGRREAHATSTSQLSPTGQVELEDSQLSSAWQVELELEDSFHFHPMTLLPSTNENEMESPYYHAQTPWAWTDSTSDQPEAAMLTSQTDRSLYAGAYNQRRHNHRLGNLEWEEHDQLVENTRRLSDEVVLHANFNSSPVHPSDLINVALLSEYPAAKVALTHDDVWCDLLRNNFPKLNAASLMSIARSYTIIDEYGINAMCLFKAYLSHCNRLLDCVTLEKVIRTSATSMPTDRQMVKKELSDSVSLDNTSTYRVRQVQSGVRDIPPRFLPSGGGGGETQTDHLMDSGLSCQRLYNYVGRRRLGNLEWEEHDQPVENYRHLWTATVRVDGTTYGKGQGPTKAVAREIAASRALEMLDARYGS
ncbi:hypothetical protein JOM56_015601 [Amanita muscaria]